MTLVRLIYHSACAFDFKEPGGEATLAAIHRSAKRNNALHQITGALFYDNRGFVQVLEGPKTAVTNLFMQHIARDPRHHGVMLDEFRPISTRMFPKWAMGLVETRQHVQHEINAAINSSEPARSLALAVAKTGVNQADADAVDELDRLAG